MKYSLSSVLALTLLVSIPSQAKPSAPEANGSVQEFASDAGASISILPIKLGDKAAAIVEVQSGLDKMIDGSVLQYEVDGSSSFVLGYQHRELARVTLKNGHAELALEETPGVIILKPTKASHTPSAMLATFKQHSQKGRRQKVGSFQRSKREKAASDFVAQRLSNMNKLCDSNISASVDWSSVSDLEVVDSANYCSEPIKAVGSVCKWKKGARKDEVRSFVKNIRCRMDPTESTTLSKDGTLRVSTHQGAMNQAQKMQAIVEKRLTELREERERAREKAKTKKSS